MRLTWFGHSCFLLETARHRLVLDPFLDSNPCSPVKAADLQCDFVLCSHGHEDHCADAVALARRCDATILANYELGEFFARQGARVHTLNPGGGHEFPFGHLKLTLAVHSSSYETDGRRSYMGEPCGLLIRAEGRIVYHAGDTALFSDLRLVARPRPDVALLPIGDNYTMGPEDALAALDMVRPRLAVPMHYDTWPVIAQDAAAFARRAGRAGHKVRVLAPGEGFELPAPASAPRRRR